MATTNRVAYDRPIPIGVFCGTDIVPPGTFHSNRPRRSIGR